MDYGKYKNALEKAKARYNEIRDTNCSEKEFLLELFPELKESEDERIRKDIMILVKDWWDRVNKDNISTKEQMIAWLEKQKEIDKEIVFRPLAGTDIITAARQALEKIEIGKEVVLAFNGAYIPVNGKTVAEICNEYFAWTEKQGEKKVSSVDFKAKDWYVSNVDGKIHDVTYNAADNVEKKGETKNEQEALNNWYVEYVYILDYSTGRVIVAKHDVEESISELFEQLGLKESQCHYMTSSNILSIEYINF